MSEDYKATPLIVLRDLVKQLGPEAEAKLKATLSIDEHKAFSTCMPISLLDIQLVDTLIGKVSPIAFAQVADPVWEHGRVSALDNIRGIYRVLVKVVSVETIIKQAARLWKTYHMHGVPTVEDVAPGRATFMVREYQGLPPVVRHNISGYLAGLIEAAGGREVRVREDFADPEEWRWTVTYA